MTKRQCRNETLMVLFMFVMWIAMCFAMVGILKWGEWIAC